MNNTQLGGAITGSPSLAYDGTAIRFYLRARYPPVAPSVPSGIGDAPCRLFNERQILLEREPRNVRVGAAGRLERIVSEDSGRWRNDDNRRQNSSLEMIVNPQGLRVRRGR